MLTQSDLMDRREVFRLLGISTAEAFGRCRDRCPGFPEPVAKEDLPKGMRPGYHYYRTEEVLAWHRQMLLPEDCVAAEWILHRLPHRNIAKWIKSGGIEPDGRLPGSHQGGCRYWSIERLREWSKDQSTDDKRVVWRHLSENTGVLILEVDTNVKTSPVRL